MPFKVGPVAACRAHLTFELLRQTMIDRILIKLRREEGQTMAEYSLVVSVIVIGVIAAIGFLALAITGEIGPVATRIGSIT